MCGACVVHVWCMCGACVVSSIDMYNNDVGKKLMKLKGTLTSATLYFAS